MALAICSPIEKCVNAQSYPLYSGLDGIITKPLEVVQWVVGKVNPIFGNFGCELVEFD